MENDFVPMLQHPVLWKGSAADWTGRRHGTERERSSERRRRCYYIATARPGPTTRVSQSHFIAFILLYNDACYIGDECEALTKPSPCGILKQCFGSQRQPSWFESICLWCQMATGRDGPNHILEMRWREGETHIGYSTTGTASNQRKAF